MLLCGCGAHGPLEALVLKPGMTHQNGAAVVGAWFGRVSQACEVGLLWS